MTRISFPGHHIAALRAARYLIADEHDRFICLALMDVMRDQPGLANACRALREYFPARCEFVAGRLANLEDWLDLQLGRESPPHVHRLARLAWIDRLIYQLNEDGTLP